MTSLTSSSSNETAATNSSTGNIREMKPKSAQTSLSIPQILTNGKVNPAVNKLLNRATNSKAKEIKIEDLDENMLKQQLKELDLEIIQYRDKCSALKKDNDWYINEVQACTKDTTEYIAFLEAKRNEKIGIIMDLAERNKSIVKDHADKTLFKQQQNQLKIEGSLLYFNNPALKNAIEEIAAKSEAKQGEIAQLSDTLNHRAHHEAKVARIKKDIMEAKIQHKSHVTEIERTLLESRVMRQREADAKVKDMQNAAHEKAAEYLTSHFATLKAENVDMDLELKKLVLLTQDKQMRKDWLEKTNRDLDTELRIRKDVIKIQLERIAQANKVNASLTSHIEKSEMKAKRREMIAMLLKVGILSEEKAKVLEMDSAGATLIVDGLDLGHMLHIQHMEGVPKSIVCQKDLSKQSKSQ